MDAVVTGAATTERGHMLVRVRCPWCARIHVHWLVGGHSEYQAPTCGTPCGYWVTTAAIERHWLTSA